MKYLIFLILMAANVYAQEPPKKTNTITIKNNATAMANFKHVGQTLLAHGFAFENVDDVFNTLTTTTKSCSKTNTFFKLHVVAGNGFIKISGQYNVPGLNAQFYPIQNGGMKGSPMRVAFEDMHAAALWVDSFLFYSIE